MVQVRGTWVYVDMEMTLMNHIVMFTWVQVVKRRESLEGRQLAINQICTESIYPCLNSLLASM